MAGPAAALMSLAILAFAASGQSPPSAPADPKSAIPAATGVSKPVALAGGYVIVPNDVIWLKVYQEDDLETKAKVTREGTITLPLLGQVSVGGLTVPQVMEKVRSELDRGFIVNPQVNVTVAEFSKRKCTLLGQVQRPGIYEYSGEDPMTLMQAVGFAGGLTRLASASRVTLQRTEKGQCTTLKIKPEWLGRAEGLSSPFYLEPDDIITVGTRLF